MPHNFTRPEIPYVNAPLPNDERYEILETSNMPLPARTLDSEQNYMIDALNILDADIASVVAGNIPGFDDPANANKMLTTDGIGNLSWTLVGTNQLVNRGVPRIKLGLAAVGSEELDNGVVTNIKMGPKAILGPNIGDDTIPSRSYGDRSVTGPKVALTTINTEHLVDGAATSAKVGVLETGNYGERSVTGPKVALTTINTEHLVNGAATSEKVGVLATGNYGDATVTSAKVGVLDTPNYGDGTVTKEKLAPSIRGIPVATCRVRIPSLSGAAVIDSSFGISSVDNFGTSVVFNYTNPLTNPVVLCSIEETSGMPQTTTLTIGPPHTPLAINTQIIFRNNTPLFPFRLNLVAWDNT